MKHVLITGASSGIGRSIAESCAERGDAVVALARDAGRLEDALGRFDNVERMVVDVTEVKQLESALGDRPFGLVVANAGICRQARLDENDAVDVWNKTMAVNLNAVFHTIRLTAPTMATGSSIVAISSGLGKNARPAYAAYCASKHAVLGLVKSAALELAERQIRVNAVCPGWVDTPMSRADIEASATRAGKTSESVRQEIVESLPLGRPVDPDEVSRLVLWLASDSASAITGQAYNISCGEFSL